jgi:acetyltransferase-like isoleucine patch superfamily enzyme
MINILRSLIFKYRFNKVKKNVIMGSSHLFNQFRLSLYKPIYNKIYLVIGDDNILNCKIAFESELGKVTIGNRNYIGDSTIICRSEVIFENDIFVAWGTYFYDHNSHSIDYKERENDIIQQLADHRNGKLFIENKNWDVVATKPIRICSNVWIGFNCTILKGVTIGQGAIVGAGSVVTKDVPAWSIVAGNPAVVVKIIPENLRKRK